MLNLIINMSLNCPLCLLPFGENIKHQKAPKNLLCGHTYCKECLIEYSKKSNNNYLICPICREKGSNDKNIENFSTNFFILEEINDVYNNFNIKNDKNVGDDIKLKIITLGFQSVGKTCISKRIENNKYDNDTEATIGCGFFNKLIKYKKKLITLRIWDTAGSEIYNSLTSNYIRNSDGALFVFDLTNKDSFNSMENYFNSYKSFNGEKIVGILVGNKLDEKNRCIDKSEGINLAKKYNIKYIECSAKNGTNIKEIVLCLLETIFENKKDKDFFIQNKNIVDLNIKEKTCLEKLKQIKEIICP